MSNAMKESLRETRIERQKANRKKILAERRKKAILVLTIAGVIILTEPVKNWFDNKAIVDDFMHESMHTLADSFKRTSDNQNYWIDALSLAKQLCDKSDEEIDKQLYGFYEDMKVFEINNDIENMDTIIFYLSKLVSEDSKFKKCKTFEEYLEISGFSLENKGHYKKTMIDTIIEDGKEEKVK